MKHERLTSCIHAVVGCRFRAWVVRFNVVSLQFVSTLTLRLSLFLVLSLYYVLFPSRWCFGGWLRLVKLFGMSWGSWESVCEKGARIPAPHRNSRAFFDDRVITIFLWSLHYIPQKRTFVLKSLELKY